MELTDIKNYSISFEDFKEDPVIRDMIELYYAGYIPMQDVITYMNCKMTLPPIIIPIPAVPAKKEEPEPINNRFEILDL